MASSVSVGAWRRFTALLPCPASHYHGNMYFALPPPTHGSPPRLSRKHGSCVSPMVTCLPSTTVPFLPSHHHLGSAPLYYHHNSMAFPEYSRRYFGDVYQPVRQKRRSRWTNRGDVRHTGDLATVDHPGNEKLTFSSPMFRRRGIGPLPCPKRYTAEQTISELQKKQTQPWGG